MLNEAVVKVLKSSMWDLATCKNGEPNVVPVAFKDITEDGILLVGDVFLETTLKNIEDNRKIAVSAYDANSLEGYQIKGTAEYITEGEIVDKFKEMVEKMFNGAYYGVSKKNRKRHKMSIRVWLRCIWWQMEFKDYMCIGA